MRQVILEEPFRFVERTVPPPERKPGEALVRIHRICICGSDYHAFAGRQPNYSYPRVMGHEVSCEVLEAPPNDRGIKPGDRCAIEPLLNCGACRPCRLNRPNCCENLQLLGVHLDGGMGGLLALPVDHLQPSDKLSLDQLALVETLTIGAHAVARSGLSANEDVLIVGAGPIGLSLLQFALVAGANARIIEKVEYRREFAKRFGVEVLAEYDGRQGFVVFDATGDAEAMEASFDRVAQAGRLVLVGYYQGRLSFDQPQVIRKELTLLGSRNSHSQFRRVIGMMERGEIDVTPWITRRMKLSEVPEIFPELAGHKNYIKAAVEVQDSDL
jgi:2-desacetyl-2-hydroxyethyl bacteriochlorophyllide A dehydrogenase